MLRLLDELMAIRHSYSLIHDVYVLLDAVDHHLVSQYGLTVSQYRLLNVLLKEAPCRLIQLSDHLLVARSTVTRLIDQLEQKQLVRRVLDEHDRRSHRVTLTGRGRKMMADITQIHSYSLQECLTAFTTDDIVLLESLLSRMRAGLDAKLQSVAHGFERREMPEDRSDS